MRLRSGGLRATVPQRGRVSSPRSSRASQLPLEATAVHGANFARRAAAVTTGTVSACPTNGTFLTTQRAILPISQWPGQLHHCHRGPVWNSHCIPQPGFERAFTYVFRVNGAGALNPTAFGQSDEVLINYREGEHEDIGIARHGGPDARYDRARATARFGEF